MKPPKERLSALILLNHEISITTTDIKVKIKKRPLGVN